MAVRTDCHAPTAHANDRVMTSFGAHVMTSPAPTTVPPPPCANDRVMTSSDNGATWVARPSSSDTNAWNSVAYGDGVFVAVAWSGINRTMTSSDNGRTWTGRPSANEATAWTSVAYGNGVFVAVAAILGNKSMV